MSDRYEVVAVSCGKDKETWHDVDHGARDRYGHFRGCLSATCAATLCREMAGLVKEPPNFEWQWRRAKP